MIVTRNFRFTFVLVVGLTLCLGAQQAQAQRKKSKKQYATVEGVIKNDARKAFRVSYDEIKTSLRKVVVPPTPPFPRQWKTMNEEDRKGWLTKFYESDRGKRFLKEQERILSDAPTFEVKYNKKGNFIVYDVPPGDYGLQGRVDKDIDGVTYGFEVFAKIKVLGDVDQLKLEPVPVTITPLFKQGQAAPPISIPTIKGNKLTFDLEAYKGHYIFLNFLNSTDLTPGYQQQVQDMYKALNKTHKVKLVSVVLDKDSTKAIKWLIKKKFKQGSFGFPPKSWDDKTVNAYGVRSTPSGWLISNDEDRKIMISQHEFFRLASVKSSITKIVSDRIEGKDTPTLAKPKKPESESDDRKEP